MKVQMQAIKENSAFIGSGLGSGNQIYESIYLNFKDSYLYFMNANSIGKVKFDYELEEDEKVLNNFFVEGNKFLLISGSYEYLNLNEEKVFSFEKDKFRLSTFEDDSVFEDLSMGVHEGTLMNMPFNADIKSSLKSAYSFSELAGVYPNLQGIFFRGNSIISSDRSKFYESVEEVEFENFELSNDFYRTIINLPTLDSIEVYVSEKHIEFVVKDVLSFQMSKNTDLSIIDTTDESFRSAYSHPTNFVVEVQPFINTIKFLKPFLKDVINSRVQLVIHEGTLLVKIIDNNEIVKAVELKSFSEELEGIEFMISDEFLEKAVNLFNGSIKIEVADDSILLNLTQEDTPEGQHVILTKLEE